MYCTPLWILRDLLLVYTAEKNQGDSGSLRSVEAGPESGSLRISRAFAFCQAATQPLPLFRAWRSVCSQSEIWAWILNAGMRGRQTEYAEVKLQSWLSGSLCMSNRAWQNSPSRDITSWPQHGTYCGAHKICGKEGERERENVRTCEVTPAPSANPHNQVVGWQVSLEHTI